LQTVDNSTSLLKNHSGTQDRPHSKSTRVPHSMHLAWSTAQGTGSTGDLSLVSKRRASRPVISHFAIHSAPPMRTACWKR
jgi:hypothetical protein